MSSADQGCNVGGWTTTTVESGDGYAKFWLEPVAAVTWVGFGPRDLRRIQRILNLHKADILEQRHEHRARQDQ